MTRKEELFKVFDNVNENKRYLILKEIDEVIFLENSIKECKKKPFYGENSKGTVVVLANFKVYKDLLASYNVCLKTLSSFLRMTSETKSDNPLEEWIKKNGDEFSTN